MKNERLIGYIQHPEKMGREELRELEALVARYPYFQAARILYLKALYMQDGERFQQELQSSTVHITDHKQLLRYLHCGAACPADGQTEGESKQSTCTPRPDTKPEGNQAPPQETATEPALVMTLDLDMEDLGGEKMEEVQEEVQEVQEEVQEEANTVEGGRIEVFDIPEIRSAVYCLEEEMEGTGLPQEKKQSRQDDLIDQFILSEPGMPKITESPTDMRDLSQENPYQKEELFSETLAKIYVKQHLYEKAIATYIKLSLKYPEKSVYFADRIEKIKENINNQE